MRRIIFIPVIILLSLASVLAQAEKWQVYKATHFIVYYQSAKEDFIRQLTDKAEGYYEKITDDLGFRRYNFWLWDERAKIYIYDDAKGYQAATAQPEWSSGSTTVQNKTIYTFAHSEAFFNTILPHEMAHIIFREFVGFNNPAVPAWLDEGVASFQENIRKAAADNIIRQAIKEDKFMKLEDLFGINPQSIKDKEKVNLFYAEGLSLINYLIEEFGRDKFVLFCQYLRDHQDFDRAARYTYNFKNKEELGRAWQKYIEHG